jgi:N-acetylmuramoyl-L-alanine amidase
MTRDDEKFVELKTRAKIAKQQKCSAFISIHCNAGPATAQGAEAFIVNTDQRSAELADRIIDVLTANGMKSRGIKPDNKGQHSSLSVLRNTYSRMPATLVELGFLTNQADALRLKDKAWVENVSSGMAGAIADYLRG